MRTLLTALTLGVSTPALASPDLIWRDRFSSEQREALSSWIVEAHGGLVRLIGDMPLHYSAQIHRARGGREPVPWAETRKHRGRTVHFHVVPEFPLDAFRRDWTASHEIVHLLFPYIGDRGRWFAEGIASYLQYSVMVAAGVIDYEELLTRLRERLERAASMRHLDDRSVVDIARRMRVRGANLRVYWGGAAYFLHVDRQLHEQTGQRLVDVVSRYVQCCSSLWGQGPEQLIRTLDEISGTEIFRRTAEKTVRRPGFPATAEALDWLAAQPPMRVRSVDSNGSRTAG